MAVAGEVVVAGTDGDGEGGCSGWQEGWIEMKGLQGVAWRQWV